MAEAKLRKAGLDAVGAVPAGGAGEADDPEDKGKHARWTDVLGRRRCDLGGLGLYALALAFGYSVADAELQPAEAPAVSAMRAVGLVLLALLKLSWLGIVCHGPGRPPRGAPESSSQAPQLPGDLARFLDAGRVCLDRRFGAEEGLCSLCRCWKPALTHHCRQCGLCSTWMDHHCHFAAQCIGFRNMRCFLVWLFYGCLLLVFLVAITLRHLVLSGMPDSFEAWLKVALWVLYIYALARTVRQHLTLVIFRVLPGWPSMVLMNKFKGINNHAKVLVAQLAALANSPFLDPMALCLCTAAVEKLRRAGLQLTKGGGGKLSNSLKGPFLAGSGAGTMAVVFGSSPSWRWLLPCMPGGIGDPFRPQTYNSEVCAAWADMATAIEAGCAAVKECSPGAPGLP